jgi:glycosyltransferase involved in cell wall biosynthesis
VTPRVVLGMTLYNNARHLREAADSLLAQTYGHFTLLMLDDASGDETAAVAREYERRDPRVRYARHEQRRGMVPTWHEVVDRGRQMHPGAEYFAWVSDHDRWHPEWLQHLVEALDAHPEVVLAYPLSPRIEEDGTPGPKAPRMFDTLGVDDVDSRWSRFCHEGVGAGDMVYGLMRMPALTAAGTFRPVLRPDRLLVAELTLQGQIHQVQRPLWFRRLSGVSSVARQSVTLFAGAPPRTFLLPAWLQHAAVLARCYRSGAAPVRIPSLQLARMLALYSATYAWRHVKKSETAHRIGRGVDNAHWVKKVIKKAFHVSIYWTLVTSRRLWGITRRQYRKAVYETLMAMHALRGRLRRLVRGGVRDLLILTHRLGLRGGGGPR